MKLLTLFLMMCAILSAEGDVKKVVIDLTTGDVKAFEKKILSGIVAHKTHYENSLGELEAAVVIHGGAYKFFVQDLSETTFKDDKVLGKVFQNIKKRTQTLAETYDVEFLMCGVGMKKNNLKKSDLAAYVKVVPNSTIGLIDKQSEGYAYIPVRD